MTCFKMPPRQGNIVCDGNLSFLAFIPPKGRKSSRKLESSFSDPYHGWLAAIVCPCCLQPNTCIVANDAAKSDLGIKKLCGSIMQLWHNGTLFRNWLDLNDMWRGTNSSKAWHAITSDVFRTFLSPWTMESPNTIIKTNFVWSRPTARKSRSLQKAITSIFRRQGPSTQAGAILL